MAERKPLFMDVAGWHEEMAQADEATFGGLTLGGNVTMAGNLITGLGPAATAGDATSYGQAGVVFSGLDLASQKLTNIALGTVDTDGVNKGQLDSAIQGLDVQPSCRVTSDTNQGTYNASGGAGANGQITGATTTIDDVVLAEGDRVLVRGQTDAKQNGIYVVTSTTSVWDRALDFDEDDEVTANAFTFVSEGTTWADTGWTLATNDPITINTHELIWVQFSAAGVILAGDGLFQTGNYLNVGEGLGINVNVNDIEVQLGATDPGLEFTAASGIQVKAADGIKLDSNGVNVDLVDAAAGLEFSSGELQVQVTTSGAIQRLTDGLSLKLDDTPDTLDMDSDGLKVVGLPITFKIDDVTTSGTVTAQALNVVTGGPAVLADNYHTHAPSAPAAHVHAHNTLTGITSSDHHIRYSDAEAIAAVGPHFSGSHNDLSDVGADDHHAQSHAHDGIDGSGQVAHSDLTGITTDDHHNQLHDVTASGDHSITGETPGYVLTVTGTGNTFDWQTVAAAPESERVETDPAVSEAIAIGDPVYWSATDDQVAKADAGVNSKAYVFGVATTAQGVVGQTVTVVSIGEAAGAIAGLGATAGDNIYLAVGGGLSLTPVSNARVIRVGIAMNATDLWVEVQDYGKKAA